MLPSIRWILFLAVVVLFLVLSLAIFAHVVGNASIAQSAFRVLRWIIMPEFALLIVFAITGTIYESRSRQRVRRDFPPPGKLVDLGGYSLHIQRAGPVARPDAQPATPTVVLDSGLVGSVLDWRRVLPEIARFARVCAYDRGGYG